jgi:cytidyltransferase-like protein
MSATALCFGTFDGLDEGHRRFLSAARREGETLAVSVARDAHVKELKGKAPRMNERARLAAVLASGLADEAYLSDERLGSFDLVERVHPQRIVLGHDQDELEAALRTWLEARTQSLPIERLPKFPETPHG